MCLKRWISAKLTVFMNISGLMTIDLPVYSSICLSIRFNMEKLFL